MSKKIRYREPEMPESLKKLLELDVEDPRYARGARNNKRSVASNNRVVKKNKSTAKQTRPIKQNRPSASNQRDKEFRPRPENYKKRSVPVKTSNDEKIAKVRISEPKLKASNSSVRRNKTIDGKYIKETKKTSKKPIRKPEVDFKKNSSVKGTKVKKKRVENRRRNQGNIFVYVLNIFRMLIDFLVNGGDKKLYINDVDKSKLDKRFLRVNSFILLGLLLVLLLVNVITPSQKLSEAENRTLAQSPRFTVDKFLSGKYGEEFSTYVSDQFVFRKNFIKAKANFDRFIGKKEINGVYICKDGYLMEGFKRSEDRVTNTKIDAINKFAKDNKNIKLSVLLAPNKVEVYNNLLPANAPVDSQKQYLSYVKSRLNKSVKFVDTLDELTRVKNNEQLYFKTDHHWTVDGAYIAYSSYCKAINIQPVGLNSFTKSLASDKFYGSLYYKNAAQIGEPDKLEMYLQQSGIVLLAKYYDNKTKVPSLYDVKKLDTKDPYQVFTGGNHTQIKIRTNVDTDRKLILFKDSYANSMLPFLVNNYSEIMVVDLRYYSGSVKDLLNNGSYTDALILGNVNTFNTDSSILNLNY